MTIMVFYLVNFVIVVPEITDVVPGHDPHNHPHHPSAVGLRIDTNYDSASSSSCNNQTRTKRMRTSFKHHQLRTMKSYLAINQKPDAKDQKQLAQKTGLSKRVLQVSLPIKYHGRYPDQHNTAPCLSLRKIPSFPFAPHKSLSHLRQQQCNDFPHVFLSTAAAENTKQLLYQN